MGGKSGAGKPPLTDGGDCFQIAGREEAAGTGGSLKRRSPGVQARASDVNAFEKDHGMNSTTVVDMRQFVAVRDGLLFTTSQNVADAFGKLHKDVLRKIDSLECSSEFTERNLRSVATSMDLGAAFLSGT